MQHKIYALFDFELNRKKGCTLHEFLQLPKVQSAALLQYRDKVGTTAQKIENICFFKNNFHGSVIINDDLTLISYADGLHVGQEDVLRFGTSVENGIKLLRARIGSKLLGLSTHNFHEIKVANSLPLDYIGLGAYRNTSTKNVTHLLGEKISSLAAESVHDVAVIGGVKSSDKIANAAYLVLGSDLYEN